MSNKTSESEIYKAWVEFHKTQALEGYTYYARTILKMILKYIEEDKPLPAPLKDYFTITLQSVIDGGDPKEELFLLGKKGRTENSRLENYSIARIYRCERNKGHKPDEIINKLQSLGYNLQKRRVQQIHEEFKVALDIEQKHGDIPSPA